MERIALEPVHGLFLTAVEIYSRRRYGMVLDPFLAMAHNKKAVRANALFEMRIDRLDTLDKTLRALAVMAPAALLGCSWCVDFGYWVSHNDGVDPAKLRALPTCRTCVLFTETERRVLAYSEAMTATPTEVTDGLAEALRTELGETAFVELTYWSRWRISDLASILRWVCADRASRKSARCPSMSNTHEAQFDQHRPLLFTVAYEILGSASDAEDVVQDSYLRWRTVDLDQISYSKAYLVRIATRVALNAARTVQRRREDYVGPWLPEPIVTTPDVADDLVLAESVSSAMLVVLEALAPTERAVFVLREVFGLGYDEIADAIGKSAAAVRQIAHRARAHVVARRPTVDSERSVSTKLLAQLLEFLQAGDLQAMMSVLAPDVVLITDGGGLRAAALRPIVNADKVARFLLGIASKTGTALELRPAHINNAPGALYYVDGDLDTIGAIEAKNGKISTVYLVRNPLKVTDRARSLSR